MQLGLLNQKCWKGKEIRKKRKPSATVSTSEGVPKKPKTDEDADKQRKASLV